ncbi:hypothetical protein VTP01DRAFT_10637 [Rhizomucor pusillus]|uniref:uncharacterized protein n=1 Tax=Rhizomucor pusillus TaxID=4840 RepID=UPI003742A448
MFDISVDKRKERPQGSYTRSIHGLEGLLEGSTDVVMLLKSLIPSLFGPSSPDCCSVHQVDGRSTPGLQKGTYVPLLQVPRHNGRGTGAQYEPQLGLISERQSLELIEQRFELPDIRLPPSLDVLLRHPTTQPRQKPLGSE